MDSLAYLTIMKRVIKRMSPIQYRAHFYIKHLLIFPNLYGGSIFHFRFFYNLIVNYFIL
jgi:hypothetical protein